MFFWRRRERIELRCTRGCIPFLTPSGMVLFWIGGGSCGTVGFFSFLFFSFLFLSFPFL